MSIFMHLTYNHCNHHMCATCVIYVVDEPINVAFKTKIGKGGPRHYGFGFTSFFLCKKRLETNYVSYCRRERNQGGCMEA